MADDRRDDWNDFPDLPQFPPPAAAEPTAPYPQPPSPSFIEQATPPGYGQLPPPPPPPPSVGGPGGPHFANSPGGSSKGGRTFAIVVVIVGSGLVGALGAAGFAIYANTNGTDVLEQVAPDVNEATLEQLKAVETDLGLTRSEEQCVEDEMEGWASVNDILTDTTGDAQEAMVQAILDCVPDPANADALVGPFSANMELGSGGQIEVSHEEGSCIVQYIIANSSNPARALSTADGPEDVVLAFESFELCLDEADLAVVMGASGAGPQAYGDDDRLDGLQDDCALGDERACDLLYLQSSVDSEYEAFASDCAGRGTGEYNWCTPGVAFDANDQVAADDPGLLGQVALCQEGDLTACDFVYRFSPLQSESERIGFTCGGRIAIGALPDCRTRLG